jgi:hypothetical protein
MSDLVRAGTAALEAYIAAGDIGRLNPDQRIALYRSVCQSLGLNELTQPFQYLNLSGKTVLYATKSCTEQLRQIHGVSVIEMRQERVDDCLIVTVSVRDRTGREDIATGAVSLAGLKGEALSNAFMKAETKAKRRATLSVCGLAVLDESETDSIAGAARVMVEEAHKPEPKPEPKPKPKPVGKFAALAASAVVKQSLTTPVAERIEIEPSAQISIVQTANGGKVWRIDQDGTPAIAVRDPKLAMMIEANMAFSVVSVCAIERTPSGTMVAVAMIEEPSHA